MASAAFEIDPGTGTFGASPQAASSAGVTVNCRLLSLAGIQPGTIAWSIEGTNHPSVPSPTITPSGTPLGYSMSFAIPAGSNKAYLIRCRVNGGPETTGEATTQYQGKVYVLNANSRQPIAHGESTEGDATHGYTKVLDEINNQVGGGADATSLRGKVLDNTTVGSPATGDVIWYDGTNYVAGKTLSQTAIGTTQGLGLRIQNTSAATAGPNDQYSPVLELSGRYYSGSNKSWVAGAQARAQNLWLYRNDNGGGVYSLASFADSIFSLGRLAEGGDSLKPVIDRYHDTKVLFGSETEFSEAYLAASSVVGLRIGANDKLTASATTVSVPDGILTFGALPAQSGAIRLPVGQKIVSRNPANATDIDLIHCYVAGDTVIVGSTLAYSVDLRASTAFTWTLGANEIAKMFAPSPGLPMLAFDGNYSTAGANLTVTAPTGNVAGPNLSIMAAPGGPGNNDGGHLRILLAPPTGAGAKGEIRFFDTNGSSELVVVTASALEVPVGAVIVGATPALTGAVRVPNDTKIVARNNAGVADVDMLHLSTANILRVGDDGDAVAVEFRASQAHSWRYGNADVLALTDFLANSPQLTFYADYASAGAWLRVSTPTTGVAGPSLGLRAATGGTGNQNGGQLDLHRAAASGSGVAGNVRVLDTNGSTLIAQFTGAALETNVPLDFLGNISIKRAGTTLISSNGAGTLGFYGATPVAQPADQVAFTDNTAGTANRTLAALPDPTDAPASADALRDDLVTNVLPVLRNWAASLADSYNDLRANVLRPTGLMA